VDQNIEPIKRLIRNMPVIEGGIHKGKKLDEDYLSEGRNLLWRVLLGVPLQLEKLEHL